MTPEAIDWLLRGEQGISSRAIFNYLHFGDVGQKGDSSWPHDPDDFRRCELLLRAVPVLRQRLAEMKAVHPVWAALVDRWEDIAALIEREAPGAFRPNASGSAPKAYELMQAVIDSVDRAA